MKKIVIIGTSVYGVENFGDEALLKVLTDSLHKELSDLEIVLFARHPGEYLDKNFNLKSLKNIEHDSKAQSIGRWFYGLNPNDSTDHLKVMINKIEECDLLIIAGDPFAEIVLGLYKGLISYAALIVTIAKFLQKPVMLYAIHMGRPLQSDFGKELTKFVINNADIITLREDFSNEVLKEMELNPKKIVVLSDPAFGLEPVVGKDKGFEILQKENIVLKTSNLVGINFRFHYWEWKIKDWIPYRDMIAKLCDYIIEAYNTDILFIPNCTYDLDHKYEDDRPGAEEIYCQINNKEYSHLIKSKYTLFETLNLFPLLDLHYSSRRHSLCFAALHGVPILGSGAAGKWHIKPIMDELGCGKNFIPQNELNYENLKNKFDQIWENKNLDKKNIVQNLPRLKEKANSYGKVVSDFIKEYYKINIL